MSKVFSSNRKHEIPKAGYFIKHFFGTLFFFLILFVCAGRLNFWQGWIYVIISLVMFLLNYTVLRLDPELMNERSKPGEETRKWDRSILGLSFLFTITMYVVAGLDSGRYHWSPVFHREVCAMGIILTISGQLLFLIAQKQNKFFSSTFRIQSYRGHFVYETGLYKLIRHPAYLGSVIQSLGFPLLIGSLWSIIPAGFLVVLFIIRIYLEDKTLKQELKGYLAYSHKTRYKIIPYIW